MAKYLKADCFKIVNRNGQPVLFRTDDVSVNQFTFTITNLTGEALLLTGGTPDTGIRAGLPATSAASTFSIDFEAMLSAEVMAGLQLALPVNWNAVYVAGNFSQPPSWSMAPAADTTLGAGETLTFLLENIKSADTRPGNFEILYRNIPGYDDPVLAIPKHLDVLNVPDPQKKNLPFKDGYINPIHPIRGQSSIEYVQPDDATEAVLVYITYDAGALIENGFTYVLTNTSKDPLVPAGTPVGIEPPVLYLSFVFGDESYAITTQSLADNNITIDINSQLLWLTTAHTSGTAYWSFFPQTKQVMEGLETIFFPIKKIITQLNIPPDTISLLYVQLNNIPGYNDAAYTVQLQKKIAIAEMLQLESDQYTIPYGENVRLSWVSSLAKRVTISYETRDKQVIVLDSAKGEIKLNGTDFLLPIAPSAEYTVIRATAYDNTDRTSSKEITITVNQKQAAILSFTATPILVKPNTSTDITLSWTTEHTRTLMLLTPDGPVDVTGKLSAIVKVSNAYAFTLEAWSYGTHYPAPTRARQIIYTWASLDPIPLALTRDEKQIMPAIAYNNQTGHVFTMNRVNNTVYNINSSTSSLVQTVPSLGMALSPDGQRLFSFIADRGYFSAVTYEAGGSTARELFREFLQYDKVHQFQPVGADIYCTVTSASGKQIGNYLVILPVDRLAEPGNMEQRILLGTDPGFSGMMCISGTSTKFCIMISETSLVVMSAWTGVKKYFTFPSSPAAIIGTRASSKLYVACPDRDQLSIIHTEQGTILGEMAVSNGPSSLALSPDEKYLCVSCFRSNEIVLIDTATDTKIKTLTVGNNPLGACFSSDGKMLFVANYCSKSVSVIEMATLQVSQTMPTTSSDGNPFAVAVLNDVQGYKVYVTKESWPQRMSCSNPVKNTTDNISVFSIVKPVNTSTEL